jgi:hypothetical protein
MLFRVLQIQNTSILGNRCAWPKGSLRQSDCSCQILQISLQAKKIFLTYESGHRSITVRLAQRSPPFWHKGSQRRAYAHTGECILYRVGWTSQHYFRGAMKRHSIQSLKQDRRHYRINRVRLRLGPRFNGKYTYYGRTNSYPQLVKATLHSILFDGENISFDASLVIYINSTNIPPIMIINRIYENQNLLSL